MVGPRTLLLIDGHHRVRGALARRLAREPAVASIAEAADLDDGLHAAETVRPDAIIVDPMTVDRDPGHVVWALAAFGRPVVVLTASMMGHEAQLLHEAGAAALLLKGTSIVELLGRIEQAIARVGG